MHKAETGTCWHFSSRNHHHQITIKPNQKAEFADKFKICMPMSGIEKEDITEVIFLPLRVEVELIVTLQAPVSKKMPFFGHNYHIWAWNLDIGKSFWICKSSLFLPGRVSKLGLFSIYGQGVVRYRPISEIAFLGTKVGNWQKFQKLHMYSISTPCGRH